MTPLPTWLHKIGPTPRTQAEAKAVMAEHGIKVQVCRCETWPKPPTVTDEVGERCIICGKAT